MSAIIEYHIHPVVRITMDDTSDEDMQRLVREAVNYYFDEWRDIDLRVTVRFHGPFGPRPITSYQFLWLCKERALKCLASKEWAKHTVPGIVREIEFKGQMSERKSLGSFPECRPRYTKEKTRRVSRFVRKPLL